MARGLPSKKVDLTNRRTLGKYRGEYERVIGDTNKRVILSISLSSKYRELIDNRLLALTNYVQNLLGKRFYGFSWEFSAKNPSEFNVFAYRNGKRYKIELMQITRDGKVILYSKSDIRRQLREKGFRV